MKHRYLTLLIALCCSAHLKLSAQITADSVPPGMFAVNPYIALSVSPCNTFDSTLYDINCDGNTDFAIVLYKGATIVDGANFGWIRVVNDSFEFCKDTGGMVSGYPRPHYFNTGDPLVPVANSMWANDTYYQFGDYGCMVCAGPASQNNVFIAFRNGAQVGWMKVSFMFTDLGSCSAVISLTIHEVLSPCLGSDVNEQGEGNVFSIVPNPVLSSAVITTHEPMEEGVLRIYNSAGQLVMEKSNLTGTVVTFDRGGLADGVYLMELYEGPDLRSSRSFVISGN